MEGMRSDEFYMRRALEIAKKGEGHVSPNPMVGAVIVKEGKIVSEGYHRSFGKDHAEIEALKKVNYRAEGTTLYVNLEPCSHYGKTPPCTEAIISSGIKRVVVGMLDPNPAVSGKGVKRLREEGIEVKVGVLEKECVFLNRWFVVNQILKRPYVELKIASTLDGKIATHEGESKWITSKISREEVHRMRAKFDAVLVGIGTVIKDNPRLNVRLVKGRNPKVVILDSTLKIPRDSEVLGGNREVIIVTGKKADPEKERILKNTGPRVITVESRDGLLDLKETIKKLHTIGIHSILVEGGERVFTSFLEEGLVDGITLFIAPKLLGGKDAKGFFSGKGRPLSKAIQVENLKVKKSGDDLMVECFVNSIYKIFKEGLGCSQG